MAKALAISHFLLSPPESCIPKLFLTLERLNSFIKDSSLSRAFNTAFRRTFGRTPSAYRRLLTADTAAADEIFHQRYVSRRDETVMRVLRTWASRAAGGAEPCATANLLARPSPVEEALELARTLTARLERMADGGPGA